MSLCIFRHYFKKGALVYLNLIFTIIGLNLNSIYFANKRKYVIQILILNLSFEICFL